MKKATSKIIAILLAMSLVFTTAGVAFADSSSESTVDTKSLSNLEKVVNRADLAAKKGTGTVTLTHMATGMEQPIASVLTFGSADVLNGTYKGMATPVTVPAAGTMILGAAARGYDSTLTQLTSGSVYFGLYYDAACTNAVDSYGLVTADGVDYDARVFKVPAAGTYYVGVSAYISSYSTTQNYTVGVAAGYINGSDRTLVNKTWSAVGQKESQTNYLYFKANNNGYVKVTTSGLYGYITLMNGGKTKAYSNNVYMSDSYKNQVVFGVKKGTTYCLKVAANYNSDGGYMIQYTNGKISEKSGSKKSKAVTLKKNKTKKGYIAAGSKQADWYKIKLTSKKKLTITVKGGTNDNLKIAVYKGSKRIPGTPQTFWDNEESRKLYSNGKLSRGTYYVKVYRGNSKSSGYYTLKWK